MQKPFSLKMAPRTLPNGQVKVRTVKEFDSAADMAAYWERNADASKAKEFVRQCESPVVG